MKTFLLKHPKLMNRYVNFVFKIINSLLKPLQIIFKHLLKVQNLDLNTVPGLKAQIALQEGFNSALDKLDEKDYDADFDFSWAHKKLKETNVLLNKDLNDKEFRDLTDISRFNNAIVAIESELGVTEMSPQHKENRARALVDSMVVRGLVIDNAEAKKQQLEDIMKFSDSAFEALQRIVEKHSTISSLRGGLNEVVNINEINDLRNLGKVKKELTGSFSRKSQKKE